MGLWKFLEELAPFMSKRGSIAMICLGILSGWAPREIWRLNLEQDLLLSLGPGLWLWLLAELAGACDSFPETLSGLAGAASGLPTLTLCC